MEKFGEGGFGSVYHVKFEGSKKRYVMKMMTNLFYTYKKYPIDYFISKIELCESDKQCKHTTISDFAKECMIQREEHKLGVLPKSTITDISLKIETITKVF